MADNDANDPTPAVAEDNDDLRFLAQRPPPSPPPLPPMSPCRQPSPGPAPREQNNPAPHHLPDPNILLHHVEQLGRQIADLQRQIRLDRRNAAPLAQGPQEPARRGRGRGAAPLAQHPQEPAPRGRGRGAAPLAQDPEDPENPEEAVPRGRGRGAARGNRRAGRFLGERNARYGPC
ncbi:proline-rich protein HaeIII subfamily 1-like [Fopius arisanus]|uniref:Proline-rich protein HaeIII subfamily 1-like n=1 Tax=Fopius arisanus TaxID=64838 RepID=A0A9R1TQ42_9HYME|nr:PREDICTED: proline-rich protein HaeIII subfamily 1-like [Fopius arisanus]